MRKSKTKLILILLVIIAVLGLGIAAFMIFGGKKGDKVVAKVNGQKIYQSEIDERLNAMFRSFDQKVSLDDVPDQVLESLVKDVYLQRELDKIAAKSKAARSDEVKSQIENFKKAVIRQAYIEALIKEKVTDEAIKNKYSELSSEIAGKKELHLRHILVESEDTAKKVADLLKKKGANFAKVAKEYSKDTANAKNGGDLGYIIPDNLDEDFANAVKTLKKGQISDPIKTKYGWHIVKLEDSRDADLPEFEKAKASVADELKQSVVEEVVNSITKGAKVKILIEKKQSKTATSLPESATNQVAAPEVAAKAAEPTSENAEKK